MGNFKKGNRGSGRLEMHSVICSECGKKCEVPFKPTGERKVYCSECFNKQGGGNSRRSDRRNSSFGHKKMFEAVCNKCGKRCEVPFKPTGEREVYCSECFGQGVKSKGSFDKTSKQLEIINSKLDKILESLNSTKVKEEEKQELKAKKEGAKSATAKPKKATTKKEIKKTAIKPKKESKTKTKAKSKKKASASSGRAPAKKPTTKKVATNKKSKK